MSDPAGNSKTIVVALGGNAILTAGQAGTAEEQIRNLELACRYLVPLIQQGHHLVITHGNGPQVGNLSIQQEESEGLVPKQPLDLCVGMTQGQIGAMLQQSLDQVRPDEARRSGDQDAPAGQCIPVAFSQETHDTTQSFQSDLAPG